MKAITQAEVDSFAKTAVSNLFGSGIPLTESIAKLAEENELNPIQSKRVAEMANGLATLKLLEEGHTEKQAYFKLADPSDVIKQAFSKRAESIFSFTNHESIDYYLTPTEHAQLVLIKSAEECKGSYKIESVVEGRELKHEDLPALKDKVKQAVERLEDELRISSLAYDEKVAEISKILSLNEKSFRKIAIDSVAAIGNKVFPVLKDLHNLSGLESIQFTKIGSNIRYYPDTDSKEVKAISELVFMHQDMVTLASGRQRLKAYL